MSKQNKLQPQPPPEIQQPQSGLLSNLLTPRRLKGLDLSIAGGGGFLALWAFTLFAPLVIGGYGVYRLLKGQWARGIGLLLFALSLYGAIKFFAAWLLLPKLLSLALLVVGLALFFKPSKD